MIWVPVGIIVFFLVAGPWIMGIALWARLQEAQVRLRAHQRRLAELEKHAGIARPDAGPRAAADAAGTEEGEADFEERIAVVWFSRIGAAVVLAGAAWLFLSPAPSASSRVARVAAGALGGLAALGFAELERRRTRRQYFQAIVALGIALLLASAFALRIYGLVGPPAAWVAVAAAALLGAGMAVRHDAELPLVLTLAGILLAPVLLRITGSDLPAMAWTVALGGAGAALAARRGFAWPVATAMVGTSALFAAWAAGPYRGTPLEQLAGAGAWVVLGATWAAVRPLAVGRAGGRSWSLAALVAALSIPQLGLGVLLVHAPATLAAVLAAIAVAGAVALHREGRPELLGVPLGAGAAALAAPAVQFATGRAATTLALAAWCAVYFAALLRPRAGAPVPSRTAVVLAGAAGTLFLVLDGGVLAPHLPWTFPVVLAVYSAVQLALAQRRREPLVLALAAGVTSCGLVGSAVHASSSGDPRLLTAAGAWALFWIGSAFAQARRGATPAATSLSGAAAAAVAFALAAVLVVPRDATGALAALVAAAGAAPLALGLLLRDRMPRAAPALFSLAVVLLGAAAGTAASGAAATLVWAAGATALVAVGFGRGSALTRRLGLGLFAGALAKLFLWDLWRLPGTAQVAAFVGVGGLLLAASWLYARRGGRDRTRPHFQPGNG
jgi:predicted membrane protein DUF2339